ncbi:MAG TPA: methionyl-tRNA formyltransferase, partial [Chloroflexota bacterium]|nr:methionyl-tRNA formyltransferase [Chloroflexota bacterium]
TTASLTEKLAQLGARELAAIIGPWVEGRIEARPQDEALATMTRPLRKEDGRIQWRWPAWKIARRTRAMFPWPGAFTSLNGTILKVLAAEVLSPASPAALAPGLIAQVGGEPVVGTGEGALRLTRIQPAGRKAMSGAEWLRGTPAALGSVLEDRT